MNGPCLSAHPYSFDCLCDLVARFTASRGEEVSPRKSFVEVQPHLGYLKEYFAHFSANSQPMTILAEQAYIDRDFVEDHASYYVSCFLGKYSPVCSRLHFFRRAFTLSEFRAAVDGGEHSGLNTDALQQDYLGFIVLKPLPSTFIGRTCLATYADQPRRHFPVTRNYRVHVAGLELEVASLAFQQQDTVAAACATSALWSIFHGTGVLFHHAIPSPTQITKSATEGVWTRGRGFPSRGLYPEQMAVAIRRAGLEPEMVGVETAAILRARTYAYLRAGIPVVLNAALFDVSTGDNSASLVGRHAVAVTGFSVGNTAPDPLPANGALLASSRIDKLYVHDDGIGPFARLPFSDRRVYTLADSGQKSTVPFVMGSSWIGADGERGSVLFAPELLILPLYHKIRIPLDAVLKEIFRLDAAIEGLRVRGQVCGLSQRLEWDVFLSTGAAFKTNMRNETRIGAKERLELLETCLPRFLWRATAVQGSHPVFELLYDGTDIEQSNFLLRLIRYDHPASRELFPD